MLDLDDDDLEMLGYGEQLPSWETALWAFRTNLSRHGPRKDTRKKRARRANLQTREQLNARLRAYWHSMTPEKKALVLQKRKIKRDSMSRAEKLAYNRARYAKQKERKNGNRTA